MEHLIYGKSGQKRIVGLEVRDATTEIFKQQEDGTIISEFKPNSYWLLSDKPLNKNFTRLKGDLHYKFGTKFNDRQEFNKMRSIWKNEDKFDIWDGEESFMVKEGYGYFQDLKHSEVSILSFDIETNGVKLDKDSFVVIITNTFRDSKGNVTRKLFSYDEYVSQVAMIQAWCKWVREINPSLICGHNIFGFDLPFLHHCSIMGLELGRDGSVVKFDTYESKFRKDGSQFYHYFKAKCYGRNFVDTMFLAIKYDVGRKYESYGLKYLIKHEGLEKTDREFYDASQIRFTYKDPVELEKIKKYGLDDSDDSLKLYDLMVPPFFYMSQNIPKTFQNVLLSATGSPINSIMMRAYLQDGHSLPKADDKEGYEGATVVGNPGLYYNVHKVDVASLYPSIMIQYEVHDAEKDPNQYFLSMVKTFTKLRLEYKKKAKDDKYYDDLQGAYKIFINSCYGFLGTRGLNFNCPSGASFITETGREVLEKSIEWAESKGFKIVNADTDSIAYMANDDQLCDENHRKALLAELNSLFPEMIRFEDDGFFPSFFVFKEKNYALFDGKKVKLKGSAFKDAKKEIALKEMMMEIVQALLDKKGTEELKAIYMKNVFEIRDGIKDIKRWCSKKTLTDKVFTSERTNETKVLDAIAGTEYKESDKIWVYFAEDESLQLMEKYDGKYHKERMYKKIFNTAEFFMGKKKEPGVLPLDTFPNYSLKKNQKLLELV